MHPHTRSPFDTRKPGNPSTAEFLDALGDPQAAKVYREAMGDEGDSPTTDTPAPEPTPDELARLQAIEDRERGRELIELRKREYLDWAEEFSLGGIDPQAWITDTFTFNPNGTVAVDDNLNLWNRSLTRLPPALTRVDGILNLTSNGLTSLEGFPQKIHGGLYLAGNQITSLDGIPQEIYGDLDLDGNQLTSLKGLPKEIHGDLNLAGNQLTSLGELQGKKIEGDLFLQGILAQSIPEGIVLGGKVFMDDDQTALKQDAISKGYTVYVQ